MELGNTFYEFAVLLTAAGALGLVAHWLKQPLIVAFIAVGILVGPAGMQWVTIGSEIDLLARRGSVLVAAEVKLRPSLRAGAEAVTPRQRRRIARAVEAYIARHPDLAALNVRFDVVLVVPWHWPHHIMDAWRP